MNIIIFYIILFILILQYAILTLLGLAELNNIAFELQRIREELEKNFHEGIRK